MRRLHACTLALLLPAIASAESGPSLAIEPAEERFTGDSVKLTLTVPSGEDARVTIAPFEFEGLAARDVSTPRFDRAAGAHRVEIELVALEPGARWVGPLTARIHRGGATETIELPQKLVEIRSLLVGAESLEPKPPSEPLEILEPDARVITAIYLGVAALIFGVLGALLARAIQKRRAAARPPPPPRPPWEIALEALAGLREARDRGLDEEGVEAWADAVSDVVREYLGARYGFDGLESTTDELLASLHEREPSEQRLGVVHDFLGECDLVKFAKARLELAELDGLLEAATKIVEETRSVPIASPEEGAA